MRAHPICNRAATVQDAAGNTVTNFTGNVTFSQTAGTGSVSGLGADAATAGVASKTVTGVLAGAVTRIPRLVSLSARSSR